MWDRVFYRDGTYPVRSKAISPTERCIFTAIITDKSSTNLDSWSLQQLRALKVGGNASLSEFFTKRGGGNLLPPNNHDARARYTSNAASLYKEELQRRIAEDARQYPNGIHIDGLDLTPMATQTSTPAEKDDDFFESWDKAKATPSPRPSKPSSPAPPSIGAGAAAAKPATGPRTVTSSSLRTGGAKPAARPMKLGSKLGGSKLGAKKAAAPIDFEEAQRKAREEEERIKRLGYDKKREEEEAAALKQREEEERRKNQAAGISSSRSATPLSSSRKKVEDDKPVPIKLGFGQIASTAPPPKAVQKSRAFEEDADSDASGSAKERFGNQKSISSDMYFGRGNYDPNASAEAKTRLQNFQGATAISSNAYFGREEEDEDDLHGGEGMLGIEGNETYQALDRNVRDMAQKVMSDPNVQQITDQIRQGALRFGDWMASLESR